ncbi:MAG: DUF4245 domain-containing protein, partial [Terrimesophilobacter sp.]
RPETPQEAADRRAEASRVRRQSKTFVNLVIALLASFAVVAVVVLVVVRPDAAPREPIDYAAIAAEADTPVPLAAPTLSAKWSANSAVYNASAADGVAHWYVGFVTPADQFIALRQGIGANPTWLANELTGMRATGTTTIDGVEWTVYDRRGAKDVGNRAYALSTVGAQSTYVLFGTASDDEFATLAQALAETITADN